MKNPLELKESTLLRHVRRKYSIHESIKGIYLDTNEYNNLDPFIKEYIEALVLKYKYKVFI